METETQRALKICIEDARRRELGVQASTSPFGPLVSQIRGNLTLARELGLFKPPFYRQQGCMTTHEYENLPEFKVGEVTFVPGTELAFAYISVAGCTVYREWGLGIQGTHSSMTTGDSLLPGIWWGDIKKAAKVLASEVEKAKKARAAKKAQEAQDLAQAAAFLSARAK